MADLAATGTAVVIVNAPKAPHADVVVVIPRVAVLLVQCKHLSEGTPLGGAALDAELSKLVLPDALRAAAGLPADADAIRVLATTKAVGDGRGFIVWHTGPASLAPLGTPIPPECARRPEAKRVETFRVDLAG